jgi:hypothetical protein
LRSSTVVDVIGADSIIDYARQGIDGDGNRYDVIVAHSGAITPVPAYGRA